MPTGYSLHHLECLQTRLLCFSAIDSVVMMLLSGLNGHLCGIPQPGPPAPPFTDSGIDGKSHYRDMGRPY